MHASEARYSLHSVCMHLLRHFDSEGVSEDMYDCIIIIIYSEFIIMLMYV